MVSGTTIGLAMMCLIRVVARSGTGSATACLTWTVPATASSASSTGNRECPDCRARSMTWVARSPSSTLTVRTRGVMISPAVRVPNSTDRSISSAVSVSSVPCSAERWMSDASSAELLADRSSSCGSIPSRRTSALAEPLSTRIGTGFTEVKVRWKSWVARATCIGRAIARFLGTSSPKIIVSKALRVERDPHRDRAHGAARDPQGLERPVDQLGDRGLGEVADGQVGDRDADLRSGELGRE